MTLRRIPDGVSLGEAVRFLREQQGLTLRGLADRVGISAPFLSDIEHGRRSTDRLDELATALNVSADELRGLDGRVTSELKEWLAANPKLVVLLKDMQGSGRPIPLEALRSAARKRAGR